MKNVTSLYDSDSTPLTGAPRKGPGTSITYASVSIPTNWAVAGPHWQLASVLFSKV